MQSAMWEWNSAVNYGEYSQWKQVFWVSYYKKLTTYIASQDRLLTLWTWNIGQKKEKANIFIVAQKKGCVITKILPYSYIGSFVVFAPFELQHFFKLDKHNFYKLKEQ